MDGAVGLDGEWMPLGDGGLCVAFGIVEVMGSEFAGSGGLTRNEQFVTLADLWYRLNVELRHTDIFEEVGASPGKYFFAGSP